MQKTSLRSLQQAGRVGSGAEEVGEEGRREVGVDVMRAEASHVIHSKIMWASNTFPRLQPSVKIDLTDQRRASRPPTRPLFIHISWRLPRALVSISHASSPADVFLSKKEERKKKKDHQALHPSPPAGFGE